MGLRRVAKTAYGIGISATDTAIPEEASPTRRRQRGYRIVVLSTLAVALLIVLATMAAARPGDGVLALFLVGLSVALIATAWLARPQTAEPAPQAEDFARDNAMTLATMAHDIRNPVATILSAMELLSDTEGLDETSRHMVDAVGRSARALSALVLDHLDCARIDAGAIRLVPRSLGLDVLLSDAECELQAEAESRGVALSIDGVRAVLVEVDPVSARRILTNLIFFALQASAGGDRVLVRCAIDANRLVVRVGFSGAKIRHDAPLALFARDQHLALYVAKRLAELQGGALSCGREGDGTMVVTAALPLGAAPSVAV